MAAKKYQKLILINAVVIFFLFIVNAGCQSASSNNQRNQNYEEERNCDYNKILDFSTSSSFVTAKLCSGIDTMTVVLPSEILAGYLRDTFSSDSSYGNAILNTTLNNTYLVISPIVYNALQNYSVNFTDSFISSWKSKSSQQIVSTFFKLNYQEKYYSCFENDVHKNEVLYLLIIKKSEVHIDDETGCVVVDACEGV